MRQCMGTGTQVHAQPRALGVVWHPPTGGLCQGMRVQEGGGGWGVNSLNCPYSATQWVHWERTIQIVTPHCPDCVC